MQVASMRDALPILLFFVLIAGAPFYLSKGQVEAQMRKEVCFPNPNYTPTNKLSRQACTWSFVDFKTLESCKQSASALNASYPEKGDVERGITRRTECFIL